MNLILIPPTAELPRWGAMTPTDGGPRFHLLLSHMCNDPHYVTYYIEHRTAGEYLILDNGADELAEGQGIKRTLALATDLRAQEVVLPDVQHEGQKTLDHSLEALSWLMTEEGYVAYSRARKPRLMVVPQGKDAQEWGEVAERLIDATRKVMQEIGGPTLVVGVAKQYDKLPGGRSWCCGVLRPYLTPAEDVHLLGWAHRLADPMDVAKAHPWVRSIDTAKPLVFGMEGLVVDPKEEKSNPPYPGRDDGYFDEEFLESNLDAIRTNVEKFAWVVR